MPSPQRKPILKCMTSSFEPAFHLTDADRADAMNQLARAVGEGRLSMAEFEDRSDDIIRAQTRGELLPVFQGIPVVPANELKAYSHADIERAYHQGRKPRLATALTGTLGLNFGAIALFTLAGSVGGPLPIVGGIGLLFLVPVLWILLYVAKVGPQKWHAPSPRQVERERRREIAAKAAAQRAEIKALESQVWAERKALAGDVTGEALALAKKKLETWNRR